MINEKKFHFKKKKPEIKVDLMVDFKKINN
jgi:hypothetical protein